MGSIVTVPRAIQFVSVPLWPRGLDVNEKGLDKSKKLMGLSGITFNYLICSSTTPLFLNTKYSH